MELTNVLELPNGKSLGSLSPMPLGVKQGYKMFQDLEITQQCSFIFGSRLLLVERALVLRVKLLVGEDKSRQRARGTTSNLQAGCVTRMIWKYCKEQTDPGGSVNSLPCEH